MSKGIKRLIFRIAVGIIFLVIGIILKENTTIGKILLISAYLICGYDILLKSIRNIKNGQVFDENFLVSIATLGAIYINEISEGVMVMVLYQLGEVFQSYAVGRSRDSITELMEIMPEYANLVVGDKIEKVEPDDVEVGSIILVKPGEKVALDGVIIKGRSYFDTSALTGESVPRELGEGDEVPSGYINQNSVIEIRTTKEFDESTVAKILELVENASSKKAKVENFITKFARYYTPIVVIGALALALLPSLLGSDIPLNQWIKRACTLLVISCPCALVISVPLSFFGGIGGAAREGILIKGSNYIESISKIGTLVFDKTGTLTKGTFSVTNINCQDGVSKHDVIKIAALGEYYSNHPIGISLKEEFLSNYDKYLDKTLIEKVEEISGKGIRAIIDGQEALVGNLGLLQEAGVQTKETKGIGSIIYVSYNGRFIGSIEIADEIREESFNLIRDLKNINIKDTYMLTGDNKKTAHQVAKEIGISNVFSELLPIDKVDIVDRLCNEKQNKEATIAFVGDGINDAPVLMRADIGIAMGGIGSDAAIEAADLVIMEDKPNKIIKGIKIAKKTMSIVMQNIIFALGIKFSFIILGIFGSIPLWLAIFGDVGVSFIAIINSMRALNTKNL